MSQGNTSLVEYIIIFNKLIIIIIIFAGIDIVFNVAACLIRGRRRWSVLTCTSPWGRLPNLEFGIEGHFRRENLTSFLAG